MRILWILATLCTSFRLLAIEYVSLGDQTGLQNQAGWTWDFGESAPPVRFFKGTDLTLTGPLEINGIINMPDSVLAGTYRCWIKGSPKNAGLSPSNVVYQISFGGTTVTNRLDERNADKLWSYLGNVNVSTTTNAFPLKMYKANGVSVGNGSPSFGGIFFSQNPDIIVTADDYAQEWIYPTTVDASAPVEGNYIVNGHFENGIHDVSVADNTTRWYDSNEGWSDAYARSGSRSLMVNVRNCAGAKEFANIRTRPFVVRGNKAHSASIWVKSDPAGAQVRLTIWPVIRVPTGYGFAAQTNYITTTTAIPTTNWTQLKLENQILLNYPSPAQYYLEVTAVDTSSNPAANNIWFDDFWFGEGTTAPEFIPKHDIELQLRNSVRAGRYYDELNDSKILFSIYNTTGSPSLQTVNYEIYDSKFTRLGNSSFNLNCEANETSETQLDVESLPLGHFRIVAWLSNGSESEIYFTRMHTPRVIDAESSLFGGHLEYNWWQGETADSVGWNRIFSPNGSIRWDQVELSAGNFAWFDSLAERTIGFRKANIGTLWQSHKPWANRTYLKLSSVTGSGFQIGETVTQSGGVSGVVTWAGTALDATGHALQLSNVVGSFTSGVGITGTTSGTLANNDPILNSSGVVVSYNESADLIRYTNYVHQVVNRYKHGIKFWEIGNEPQQDGSLPKPNGTDYAFYHQMVIMAYEAIKAQCPECEIILVGGVNNEIQMVSALSGIPVHIRTNAYAATYHAYKTDVDASGGGFTTRAQAILNTALNYGVRAVMNGEVGTYCYSGWYGNRSNWKFTGIPIMGYRDCEDQVGGYTDRLAEVVEGMLGTIGARSRAHIYYDNRYFHQYGDTDLSYDNAYTDIDLAETIKPIGSAQRFVRWALDGGSGQGRNTTPSDIYSFAFLGYGGTPWVSLYQTSGSSTNKVLTWSLSTSDYEVHDVFGNIIAQASGEVKFGRLPVLVKGIGSSTLATLQSAIASGTFSTVADTTAPKLIFAEYPKTTATALQKHRVRVRWLGNDSASDGSGDFLSSSSIDGMYFRNKLDAESFSPWGQVTFRDLVGLSTGSHTLTVECRDRALNTSTLSKTFSIP